MLGGDAGCCYHYSSDLFLFVRCYAVGKCVKFCDEHVCLSVCSHNSKTTWPNLKISMYVTCGCGSLLLWQRCDTLCRPASVLWMTSCFHIMAVWRVVCISNCNWLYNTTGIKAEIPTNFCSTKYSWVAHCGQSLLSMVALFRLLKIWLCAFIMWHRLCNMHVSNQVVCSNARLLDHF